MPDDQESADTDEDQDEVDAAFAWFGMAVPPPAEAAPAIIAFDQPVIGITAPEGEPVALPEAPLLEGAPETPVEPAAAPVTAEAETPPTFELTAPPELTPNRRIQGVDISRLGRNDAPARIELGARIEIPANSPILQTIAALQPRGESQPLAALAASAGIELPEQFRRTTPRDPVISAVTQPSATDILRPHVVQAVADVQQAAIDTRRSEWMSQTIDRIEALRDTPSTRETSIRLSPDALGTVDVSIRHEGDRIHVRFSAETAQARTLLTEAQSRLTEIAESRGIKLGQTSVDAGVDSGTASQGQRQDAAARATTITSAPASALGSDTTTSSTDARVA